MALRWVRAHIHAFQGDNERVTIFGESAGGESVVTHLTQPSSFGLYHRAIIESGADNPYVLANSSSSAGYPSAESSYKSLLNKTGCRHLECLMTLEPTQIARAAASMGDVWGPVVDGITLTDTPEALLSRGEYNRQVPVMIGSNRDEYSLFVVSTKKGEPPSWPANMSEAYLREHLSTFLSGADVKQVQALYQPQSYRYPPPEARGGYSLFWWMAMRISTDGGSHASNALGHCTARRYARWMESGGSPGVFQYLFARPSDELLPDLNDGGYLPGNGVLVPHAGELPYVFGLRESMTTRDQDLSMSMVSYWIQFATVGDPNRHPSSSAAAIWPRYDSGGDAALHFDVAPAGATPRSHFRAAACAFWDRRAASGGA